MKLAFNRLSVWTGLLLGKTAPANDAQRRYTRLGQTTVTALAGKGVAVFVSFISVPLTLSYLGVESYGLWMTLSSLLAWVSLADLGLSSSLTNAISDAYGRNLPDLARKYTSCAFYGLWAIALLLGAAFAAVWPLIDWTHLFNVTSADARAQAGPAVAVALAIVLLSLPFSIVNTILGGYQEGSLANYWAAASNLLSLVGIVAVTQLRGGLVALVLAFSGTIILVNIASAAWLFGKHKPWLRPTLAAMDWATARNLGGTGGLFFIIQISALLIFQSANLIISHFLGASAVTPYSVTWRLFGFATFLQTMAFAALWPAYAEAFARQDAVWIRKTFYRSVKYGLLVAIGLTVPLLFFAKPIITKWAGPEAVPPTSLVIWMGIWTIVFGALSAISCLLNASGKLKRLTCYGTITAVANIVLSIALVKHFGSTGVIAATVMAYVVCCIAPAIFDVRRIIAEADGRDVHGSVSPEEITLNVPASPAANGESAFAGRNSAS